MVPNRYVVVCTAHKTGCGSDVILPLITANNEAITREGREKGKRRGHNRILIAAFSSPLASDARGPWEPAPVACRAFATTFAASLTTWGIKIMQRVLEVHCRLG